MLLCPFMSTVLALVRVLELFYVQDYWSLIMEDAVHRLPGHAASERHAAARPQPRLMLHAYQFLGFTLDVECACTLGTGHNGLHEWGGLTVTLITMLWD